MEDILILSSSEGLKTANAVQGFLVENYRERLNPIVWNQGVFEFGFTTIDIIVNEFKKFNFFIVILTPDDKITYRESEHYTPRDNILYELGFVTGLVGLQNCFILADNNIKLKHPNDLAGLTISFYDGSNSNSVVSIAPSCSKIAESILIRIGDKKMDWQKYHESTLELIDIIYDNPKKGRYRPHVVVGVNPGGAILGGLFYLLSNRRSSFFTLWSKNEGFATETDLSHLVELAKLHNNTNQHLRILIIDDTIKTGRTISKALEQIKFNLIDYSYELKIATMVFKKELNTHLESDPDFFLYSDFIKLPYSNV